MSHSPALPTRGAGFQLLKLRLLLVEGKAARHLERRWTEALLALARRALLSPVCFEVRLDDVGSGLARFLVLGVQPLLTQHGQALFSKVPGLVLQCVALVLVRVAVVRRGVVTRVDIVGVVAVVLDVGVVILLEKGQALLALRVSFASCPSPR